MKTIWDLKTEFNKEIATLKRTQAEKKMGLKNPVVQLENSKEGLTSEENQAEDRIPCFKDKIEDLDQTSKKHKQFKKPQKATFRKCETL